MWFLRKLLDKSAGSLQRFIEVIHAEEEEQSVAGLSVIGAGQGRMFVRAPLVKADQDRSIRVQDLPEVIMSGSRFRLAEQ